MTSVTVIGRPPVPVRTFISRAWPSPLSNRHSSLPAAPVHPENRYGRTGAGAEPKRAAIAPGDATVAAVDRLPSAHAAYRPRANPSGVVGVGAAGAAVVADDRGFVVAGAAADVVVERFFAVVAGGDDTGAPGPGGGVDAGAAGVDPLGGRVVPCAVVAASSRVASSSAAAPANAIAVKAVARRMLRHVLRGAGRVGRTARRA